MKVEIRALLDRSGSMKAWRKNVILGFNTYFSRIKADPSGVESWIRLVQFDSLGFDVLRNCSCSDLAYLREDEFSPRALTPIRDAMGSALTDGVVANKRYVLVILTDGEENSSTKFSPLELRSLVQKRISEGWIIIYLGANIDSWVHADEMGIPRENAMNIHLQEKNFRREVGFWSNVKRATGLGNRGYVNPVVAGLTAAAGLTLAYLALRSGEEYTSDGEFSTGGVIGFNESHRNMSMGVDSNWQEAVSKDVTSFVEPVKNIFDLGNELNQQIADLPRNFNPALGSVDEDGAQRGGFSMTEKIHDAVDLQNHRESVFPENLKYSSPNDEVQVLGRSDNTVDNNSYSSDTYSGSSDTYSGGDSTSSD